MRNARKAMGKAGAGTLACALALGCMLPAAAMATEASTDFYLKADNDKIIASAPTRIDVAVAADGTFELPDFSLENGSIFGIHLADVKLTSLNGWHNVNEDDGTMTDFYDMWTYPTNGSASTNLTFSDLVPGYGPKTFDHVDWNLTKVGTENASLPFSGGEGYVLDVTKDLSISQQFCQIDWTFEAGLLS